MGQPAGEPSAYMTALSTSCPAPDGSASFLQSPPNTHQSIQALVIPTMDLNRALSSPVNVSWAPPKPKKKGSVISGPLQGRDRGILRERAVEHTKTALEAQNSLNPPRGTQWTTASIRSVPLDLLFSPVLTPYLDTATTSTPQAAPIVPGSEAPPRRTSTPQLRLRTASRRRCTWVTVVVSRRNQHHSRRTRISGQSSSIPAGMSRIFSVTRARSIETLMELRIVRRRRRAQWKERRMKVLEWTEVSMLESGCRI